MALSGLLSFCLERLLWAVLGTALGTWRWPVRQDSLPFKEPRLQAEH